MNIQYTVDLFNPHAHIFKVTLEINSPDKTGQISSLPAWIRMSIPSVTTMALSTSIPSAIIRAPKEIRCRLIPHALITMSEPRTVMAKTAPISRPLLIPIKITKIMITMTTASTRFTMNALIEWVTASVWR